MRFVTLDGLRGIAALAVLIFHAPEMFSSLGRQPPFPFQEAYLAVDFFFMLSGFVLAHAYEDRLNADLSWSRFMVLRLIRFLPLYLAALSIGEIEAVYHLLRGTISIREAMIDLGAGLLFLPSPTGSYLFPLNPPSWSLFVELVMNALFAAILFCRGTGLLGIVVTVSGGALALAATWPIFGFGPNALGAGFEWHELGAAMLRAQFSFPAGLLLYRLWLRYSPRVNLPPIAAAAVLMAFLSFAPSANWRMTYDLVAAFVAFPAIIFFSAASKPGSLLFKPFDTLGSASYGIYVLQWPVLGCLMLLLYHALGTERASHLPLIFGVTFIVVFFSCVLLADKYFDRPMRRMATAKLLGPNTYRRSTRDRGGA